SDLFVGRGRDEESLMAETYANRLPSDLTDRDTFVLDPMLATGGTLATVISMLMDRGAASVTAICLLAAPEGLRRVEQTFAGDAGPGQGGGVHRARARRRGRPPVRHDLGAASQRVPAPTGLTSEERARREGGASEGG